MAGASFEIGDGKGTSQALTTMFRLMGVDMEKLRALKFQALREKLLEARQKGFQFNRVDAIIGLTTPKGLVTANMTGIPHLNALEAEELTKAEIEGRRQVFEYLRFLRQSVPGFEQAGGSFGSCTGKGFEKRGGFMGNTCFRRMRS